ncbi:hypothetical protein [Terribacillus saccharophilus]|uniref:hypothetical protein n=1 Tax=Terribacillus saccharophilus TaxID=361277 RepID=UPI0015956A62|nr:hypothetical protein [Terribacillus saccharophilus]
MIDLKNLSAEQLRELGRDAAYRIGTHTAAGYPIESYINQQQEILRNVRAELERRSK